MTNESATEMQRLLRISRGLIAGWMQGAGDDAEFGQPGRIPDVARFVSVFGLSAHTHRLAEQVVPMIDKGLALEAMPLIRLMYECALNAMWLAQNEDGSSAFMNKETKSRKAIARTLAQSSWRRRGFPEIDDSLLESDSDLQAQNFEALCNDLKPGGPDAYALYRLLCRFGHPTGFIVDKYARFDDNLELTALSHHPDDHSDPMWVFFTAISLRWAGSAVDLIDPSRKRRSELQEAERSIGSTRILKLSPAAQSRLTRADQLRRRAAYKAPKRTTK